MNNYLTPAEYQLSEDFQLPSVPRRRLGISWAAATVAVGIIFGATMAFVAGAETATQVPAPASK